MPAPTVVPATRVADANTVPGLWVNSLGSTFEKRRPVCDEVDSESAAGTAGAVCKLPVCASGSSLEALTATSLLELHFWWLFWQSWAVGHRGRVLLLGKALDETTKVLVRLRSRSAIGDLRKLCCSSIFQNPPADWSLPDRTSCPTKAFSIAETTS